MEFQFPQPREQFVEFLRRVIRRVFDGELQPGFNGLLNQRFDGLNKSRDSLLLVKMNVEQRRTHVARQLDVFPKQRRGIRLQRIRLPAGVNRQTNFPCAGGFADDLSLRRIQIAFVPARAGFFVGKPLEGVEAVCDRVVKRRHGRRCEASGLVANVNHCVLIHRRPAGGFAPRKICPASPRPRCPAANR